MAQEQTVTDKMEKGLRHFGRFLMHPQIAGVWFSILFIGILASLGYLVITNEKAQQIFGAIVGTIALLACGLMALGIIVLVVGFFVDKWQETK